MPDDGARPQQLLSCRRECMDRVWQAFSAVAYHGQLGGLSFVVRGREVLAQRGKSRRLRVEGQGSNCRFAAASFCMLCINASAVDYSGSPSEHPQPCCHLISCIGNPSTDTPLVMSGDRRTTTSDLSDCRCTCATADWTLESTSVSASARSHYGVRAYPKEKSQEALGKAYLPRTTYTFSSNQRRAIQSCLF